MGTKANPIPADRTISTRVFSLGQQIFEKTAETEGGAFEWTIVINALDDSAPEVRALTGLARMIKVYSRILWLDYPPIAFTGRSNA